MIRFLQGRIVCIMKRTLPWNEQTDVISDESSSSDVDMDINDRVDGQQLSPNITLDQPTTEMTSEGIWFWTLVIFYFGQHFYLFVF